MGPVGDSFYIVAKGKFQISKSGKLLEVFLTAGFESSGDLLSRISIGARMKIMFFAKRAWIPANILRI